MYYYGLCLTQQTSYGIAWSRPVPALPAAWRASRARIPGALHRRRTPPLASADEWRMVKTYEVTIPIGSMVLLYMVTFTINIPPMLAHIPYMDPMGYIYMIYEGN
jgi:hypothetical protein